MNDATMTKFLILSILTVAIFFMPSTSTLASRNNSLTITKVQVVEKVNENGETMTKFTITGDNFNRRRHSVVTLGEIGSLTIVEATDRQIVATWPRPIPGGEYRLTVSNGNGPPRNDEFDISIKVIPSDCPCAGQTIGLTTWGPSIATTRCSIKIGNRLKITELFEDFNGSLEVIEFEGTGSYQCRVNDGVPETGQIVENFHSILIADACRQSIMQLAKADAVFECEFEHQFP